MKTISLDAADIRILCAVQRHGHLSKARLAELVNLSPTPCWARFTKLKKAGLIRRYRADIAVEAFAEVAKVIVTVSLTDHRKSDFERFERRVLELDQITECIATGGGMDYVLTVVTKGLPEFQELIETLLSSDIGIGRYMTYFVTREIKSEPPNLARLAPDHAN
jgi:Lrp/AsnC family transcriptional regulator of ectoine degradation